MKILLTGSKGMLAKEFVFKCRDRKDCTIIAPEEKECDITDIASIRNVVKKIHPDTIINCAAYTDVDACERNQKKPLALIAKE